MNASSQGSHLCSLPAGLFGERLCRHLFALGQLRSLAVGARHRLGPPQLFLDCKICAWLCRNRPPCVFTTDAQL